MWLICWQHMRQTSKSAPTTETTALANWIRDCWRPMSTQAESLGNDLVKLAVEVSRTDRQEPAVQPRIARGGFVKASRDRGWSGLVIGMAGMPLPRWRAARAGGPDTPWWAGDRD